MAGTYSKYNNTDWLSTSSFLVISDPGTQSYAFNNSYLGNDIYTNLIDNESKSIQPKNLRNSILSLWDLPIFKLTTASGSNIKYIGIDSGTSSTNVDIKSKKVLFGKRTYKEYHIMRDLISSDSDFYFYNTKLDSDSQLKTKLTFLSGQNPNIYQPSIVSKYVKGRTASLYMDILNNDDIHILSRSYVINNNNVITSDNNLGSTVSVNNIIFPTYGTNSLVDINGKYLISRGGVMTWTSSATSSSSLGANGSELNIYGSKTTVNGFDLDFTDPRMTPYDLGGIFSGTTFSNDSISEVLNRIIYNNTPPKCQLIRTGSDILSPYVEIGTSPDINFRYKIEKYNNPLTPTRLTNMIPSQLAPIPNEDSIVIEGIAEAVFITPVIATTSYFKIKVEDIYGGSSSITKFIKGVYPYYYGFSTYSVPDIFQLEKFTKIIEDKGNKTIDVYGEGNLFFIYDVDHGKLNNIKFENVNNTSSFTYSIGTFSSPNGFWDSKQFYIYKTNTNVQIDLPSKKWTFNY